MSRAEHRTDPTLAELERQIAETREQLGQTVEELAAKADVPSRAKAKAAETMSRFRLGAHRAEDRTKEAAAQAADRVKQTTGRGDHRGGHGRHAGGGKGPDEITGAAAAAVAEDGSGAHLAGGAPGAAEPEVVAVSRTHDRERMAYGAAAIGLTAATAGAVVWAARHP
ncbi:DUF3618 domain-containing protein [Actinacidiphila acidipaludis]|uniref:DUF3618 domain-containing protein n=1 Tax=Actinacidiphila acidipaludis TaxID=2873382 RepID=UPI00223BAAD8|nr:DUF3618 domain-containing protein [Streptomyces acidipaludis]